MTESCRVCKSDHAVAKHAFAATTLYRCPACGLWFCDPVVRVESPSSGPSSILTDDGYSDMLLRGTPTQAKRYATLALRRYQSYCKILGRSTFSMFDIVCGAGELGAEFMKLGVDYHGMNIDTRIVESGQRRIGNRIRQEDFFQMEIDRQYDVICFHQVLEHITEPRLCAERVTECSGQGGAVHGDVPSMTGLSALLHRIVPLNQRRF